MPVMTRDEALRRLGARQRSPWYTLTRLALGAALAVAIWEHQWIGAGVVLLLLGVHPLWFPVAPEDGRFLARVATGEEVWMARASRFQRAALTVLAAGLTTALALSLFHQHLVYSLGLAGGLLAYKASFMLYCAKLAREAPPKRLAQRGLSRKATKAAPPPPPPAGAGAKEKARNLKRLKSLDGGQD